MKVCLLNDSFPPVIDGVVNVVRNYAKYLTTDHDSEVIVGTPRYPGADYESYPYPVVTYPSLDTTFIASGYRTGYPLAGKAVSQLANFRPDIIHSHCPATATIIARILRDETDAPVIFTYHTKYDIDIERVVRIRPVVREGIRLMVENIEACDDIWVVSRGAGESLRALGFSGDYHVMNNGVDFEKGRVSQEEVRKATAGYDLPEGIPVYLFVGRMMTYKGIPVILDALKLLMDEGHDFRMVLIGKGPDQSMLENRAKELGLMGENGKEGAKVIFTGPIYDRNVLRAWNTRADLFLFPSTFDTNGLVVREAAACGLGSALIRGSCAAEGVTDGRNGFLIDQTPESLAELLKGAGQDLDKLHDVGTNAMNELYLSWETCVSQAYDRYQYILEQKRAGRLPSRAKVPADYLVQLTAKGMQRQDQLRQVRQESQEKLRAAGREEYEKLRAAGRDEYEKLLTTGMSQYEKMKTTWDELFGGIRQSAAGMMENIRSHLDQDKKQDK